MAFLFILPTWPVEVWTSAMRKVAPRLDVRNWPDQMGDVADIDYAAAWLPPANVLKGLPNLKVIFSLGAGVDAILKDPTLPPGIPIVRVNEPDLTGRMTEYIVLHVLMHHRQQRRLDENQRRKIWDSFPTHAASDLAVGIMGLGVMGQDSAERLRDLDPTLELTLIGEFLHPEAAEALITASPLTPNPSPVRGEGNCFAAIRRRKCASMRSRSGAAPVNNRNAPSA